MNNIAPEKGGVNPIQKWFKDHQIDIAIFCIAVFGVVLLVGIFRLRMLTPPKEPLKIEKN